MSSMNSSSSSSSSPSSPPHPLSTPPTVTLTVTVVTLAALGISLVRSQRRLHRTLEHRRTLAAALRRHADASLDARARAVLEAVETETHRPRHYGGLIVPQPKTAAVEHAHASWDWAPSVPPKGPASLAASHWSRMSRQEMRKGWAATVGSAAQGHEEAAPAQPKAVKNEVAVDEHADNSHMPGHLADCFQLRLDIANEVLKERGLPGSTSTGRHQGPGNGSVARRVNTSSSSQSGAGGLASAVQEVSRAIPKPVVAPSTCHKPAADADADSSHMPAPLADCFRLRIDIANEVLNELGLSSSTNKGGQQGPGKGPIASRVSTSSSSQGGTNGLSSVREASSAALKPVFAASTEDKPSVPTIPTPPSLVATPPTPQAIPLEPLPTRRSTPMQSAAAEKLPRSTQQAAPPRPAVVTPPPTITDGDVSTRLRQLLGRPERVATPPPPLIPRQRDAPQVRIVSCRSQWRYDWARPSSSSIVSHGCVSGFRWRRETTSNFEWRREAIWRRHEL